MTGGGGWQDVEWSGPEGKALVITDLRGTKTQYGPGAIYGVLTGGTSTPIPGAGQTAGPVSW